MIEYYEYTTYLFICLVLRLYEKENVYLAEACQILMRNVAYEIPGIKKSISKCEQMQHVT